MQRKRIIFDISTLVRSKGIKGGILRVVNELATWARANRDDVVFAILDPELDTFRAIHEDWSEILWQGRADIDYSRRRKIHAPHIPWRDRLPDPLRELALWVHAPRRRAMLALERWRLKVESDALRTWIGRLQSLVLSKKLRRELWDEEGRRRAVIPYDQVFGPAIDFTANDVLIVPGAEWFYARPTLYADLKRKHGNQLVILCHDIIPLLFPDLYRKRAVDMFREYMFATLPFADLVIFNSQRSEQDTCEYFAANGAPLAKTSVMRFGAKVTDRNVISFQPLPYGLKPKRYALFVSNFDARKGHALLFATWKRLLTQGVPQANGFKLVFVGHRGADNVLLDEIEAHPSAGDTLLILSNVGDDALGRLYQQAAFCVFPSLYEGYGLPIIEGFGYGKAVVASTGGALPEVVGDFSPCLDPHDEQAWFETLKLWIAQPAAREHFEAKIRGHFRPTTWPEAARGFFRLLDAEL